MIFMIAQATIDQVRSLSITSIIGHYITLKKNTSSNYLALCPFHDDQRLGSFVLYTKTNTYKCFSCGEQGDGIKFVQKKLNISFSEAIEEIAKQNGIEIKYENRQNGYTPEQYKAKLQEKEELYKALEVAQKHFQNNKKTGENYLIKRFFNENTIAAFGLGYAPNDNFFTKIEKELYIKIDLVKKGEKGNYDAMRNRITIPLLDRNGRIVGFAGRALDPEAKAKYINPTDTLLYHKGNYLYNLDKARTSIIKENKVYLVEGYPNVWRMYQEGIYNVVAAGGTALTSEQIALLKSTTKNIVLCYDADNAGIKATNTNLVPLLKEGFNVSVLLLPAGMDIDDLGGYLVGFNAYQCEISLKNYIKENTVSWVAYKIEVFNSQGKKDSENQIDFANHLAELILSHPDKVHQEVFLNEAGKKVSFLKTSYKAKQKDLKEAEKKNNKEELAKVISTPSGTLVVNGRGVLTSIGSFSIQIVYQLQVPNSTNCSWILKLQKEDKEPEYLEVTNDELISKNSLKKKLYAKRYSVKLDDTQLDYLLEYLNSEKVKISEKVETLGYHPESELFFFSNLAYNCKTKKLVNPNNLSIIDLENKSYFMPYTDKDKSPLDKVVCYYEDGELSFDDVAEFVVKAWGEQESLAIAYYVASLYLDIIVKVTKNFPILFLKGPGGSGKSELAKLLMNFFGRGMGEKLSVGANSTTAAMKEIFSGYANMPFHIEDYSRSSNLLELSDFLVLMFDRTFRKTMDMETKKNVKILQPLCSCVVSSNKDPLEDGSEALASRLIYLNMKVNKRSPEHKAWFMDEKTKIMNQAWTNITTNLINYRELIEQNFIKTYSLIINELSIKLKEADYVINDRIIASYSAIISPLVILFDHSLVSCFIPLHIDLAGKLKEIAYQTIIKQHNSLVERSPLQVFWDTVQMLFNDYKTAERQVSSYTDRNGFEQKNKVAYNSMFIYPDYHFQLYSGHSLNGVVLINEPVVRLKIDDIYGRYVLKMKQLGLNPERLNAIKDMIREHRSYDQEHSERYVKFKVLEQEDTSATKKAFILKYNALKEDFGIDLE